MSKMASLTHIPACHVCHEDVAGTQWPVAITDSLDRDFKRDEAPWHWVVVCTQCRWTKRSGKRIGIKREIEGEVGW